MCSVIEAVIEPAIEDAERVRVSSREFSWEFSRAGPAAPTADAISTSAGNISSDFLKGLIPLILAD
jgi:hypothetical protein